MFRSAQNNLRLKYHTLQSYRDGFEKKKTIWEFIRLSSATTLHGRNIGDGACEVKVEVIVCFSARPLSRALSSEISLLKPFAPKRNAALSPAMCFEWIYMTSHRVPTSLFADVRACASHTRVYTYAPGCVRARARGSASMWAEIPCSGRCWTIFPWPPRDTKLGMIIPYLPTEGRAVPSCRLLPSTRAARSRLDDTTHISEFLIIFVRFATLNNVLRTYVICFIKILTVARNGIFIVFLLRFLKTYCVIAYDLTDQASYRSVPLVVTAILFAGFESKTRRE